MIFFERTIVFLLAMIAVFSVVGGISQGLVFPVVVGSGLAGTAYGLTKLGFGEVRRGA